MDNQRKAIDDAKAATGQPAKVKTIYEPFPPSLSTAHEYERGQDILVLKNEEDPQHNIMISMSRGAGRSFGKPFGFYWEQTHYPFPSMDFKLQACLEYYLSGGSWIAAEGDNYPCFEREIVHEVALPYAQALRFAMVHPARGKSIVPIGILWTMGDKFIAPYNPFGHLDTFLRCIDYDHATKKLTTEPSFLKPHPWWPESRMQWSFNTTGHGGWLMDSVPEMKGYDLLDVFFPQFGDAFTAHIARLLTGTPYGPVDFIYGNAATADHLKTFGLIAILGHAAIKPELEAKLLAAAEAGTPVVFGAQHLRFSAQNYGRAFGLDLQPRETTSLDGPVTGLEAVYTQTGTFTGKVLGYKGAGWEVVASAGGKPLVIRKPAGKSAIYVYLGEWTHEGGPALRPLLTYLARQAAPLQIAPADDQLEYVAYRKGTGAWVAVFNHGAIPVGCDRLKEPRITPPEPLVSKVKGPYTGEIIFNLARLALDPAATYSLYEVEGIDSPAFENVIAGTKPFVVKEIPSQQAAGVIKAAVKLNKRAQYVIAPKGQGEAVFFGKP